MGDTGRLSLMGYFGKYPASVMVEKDSKGPYIRFGRFIAVSQYLYEVGAIIGRAKRDKLHILAKMLATPGGEQDCVNYLQELAQNRLNSYGKEPNTFFDFFWTTELSIAGLKLDFSRQFQKAVEEKMRLEEAEPFIKLKGTEGIGFGGKFPELTEKMFKHQYELVDQNTWLEMKKYVSTFSEDTPNISFEAREKEVLSQLAVYVIESFPELVEPLSG